MGQLFNLDSSFVQRLNQLADIMLLNILVVLSSIPIVTIGAAQTALYDVTGRLARKEGDVWKSYWKAFKSNFKCSTIIWLLFLTSGLVIAFCLLFYASSDMTGSGIAFVLLCVIAFLWLGAFSWVFPLQSRFENSIKHTIRNAFHCAAIQLPRTVVMVVLNSLPWVFFFTVLPWFVRIGPLWFLLWFSFTAHINVRILEKPFSALVEMTGCGEERN